MTGVWGGAGPLRAQSLSIAPVTLNVVPGQHATSLTITNDGPNETVVQIRPFAWAQLPDDALTAAADVVVSPPIVKIPPRSSQVVRIILRRAAAAKEISYRLLIDQIPPRAMPGTVQLALRISLPMFIEPAAPTTAKVRFRLAADKGTTILSFANSGGRHETLRNIVLQSEGGLPIAVNNTGSPYLLAGVTRSVAVVDQPAVPGVVKRYRLKAQSGNGPIDVMVAAESEVR